MNQIRSQQQNSLGRRHIADIHSMSKSSSGSPSPSNSGLYTVDDDNLPENKSDSLLTSQFNDDFHTSNSFITDLSMLSHDD